MSYTCKYCGKNFEKNSSIGGHTIRCKENPRAKKLFEQIGQKNKGRQLKPIPEKKFRILKCIKCEKEYNIQCTDYLFNIGKYKKHCSHNCANSRKWSEEDKLKKSAIAKNSEKVKNANKSSNWSIERIDRTKKIMLDNRRAKTKKLYIDICLFCNQNIEHYGSKKRKYHNECWLKISGGYKEGCMKQNKVVYNGYKLHNGLEFLFAKLMDKCSIKWLKNSEIYFPYLDNTGKGHKYYPDFYLPEYDLWVETKGKIYAEKDPFFELKKYALKNLEILFHKDIKELYKLS